MNLAENHFQNLYYILRYSSFSNLDTKSFRKINFKNFLNTKMFGKRFPNGLVFGKRFPNSLVFGKFLKLIFLNSNLNLQPFISKNSKIDMDAIWWPFLTINWNLNLEKIWKKEKKSGSAGDRTHGGGRIPICCPTLYHCATGLTHQKLVKT